LWALSTARRTELHEFAKYSPFLMVNKDNGGRTCNQKTRTETLGSKKIITTGKIVDFELD